MGVDGGFDAVGAKVCRGAVGDTTSLRTLLRGRPGPRLSGEVGALAARGGAGGGAGGDAMTFVVSWGSTILADSLELLRPLGVVLRRWRARTASGIVDPASVDGADLRGRPGPRRIGETCDKF